MSAHHDSDPVLAPEPVLSTLNPDGSRRWLRPRPARGRWHRARRTTAYALMLLFFLIPYLRIGGRPVMLFDFPRREFTLFGHTFLSTDTLLFMLLFTSVAIAIFLVTSLFGRVWCGWGCPQTVYLEFLFRPIEYLIEGGPRGGETLDHGRGLRPRRLLKYAAFGVLALFLTHTFLAYFVRVETLATWVRRSPVEHPTSFFIMAGTTLAIFLDFAWFREQTCLVACPYGRLQSVLLDPRSVIVGYDPRRGEPRGRGVRDRATALGDCIDCGMCVQTCPTGIDIRNGLQMECIHCTQCIDACDRVMVKIGRPTGLIRYSTREELSGRPRRLLRTRVLVYPLAFALSLGGFVWALAHGASADVTLLRTPGAPFMIDADGKVANAVRVKIVNRGGAARAYRVTLAGGGAASLVVPFDPFPVPAGASRTMTVFAVAPVTAFGGSAQTVTFHVADDHGFARDFAYPLLGPDADDGTARRPERHDGEPR